MVCLGNICRSPLAEGILRSLADPEKVEVDSAGTAGYHVGSRPDQRSIAVARKYGIDISRQQCRRFVKEDFHRFDLIFAMDRENLANIHSLCVSDNERKKVRMLLAGMNLKYDEVPDPYYGGKSGFEEVFRLIYKACEVINSNLSSEI